MRPTLRRTRSRWLLALALPLIASRFVPTSSAAPSEGQQLFERRCTGCHQLDEARSGPPLRGVYGRAAAGVAAFPYSAALKVSHLTWSDASLDRWLADPEALVPNNDMAFRVTKPEERAGIVAYLKSLSNP